MEAVGDTLSFIIASPFLCCGWIIAGFIAGALARRVMGSSNMPFISDVILGLAGALVGGFLTSLLGVDTGNAAGLQQFVITVIVATIGASVLIFIGRAVRR